MAEIVEELEALEAEIVDHERGAQEHPEQDREVTHELGCRNNHSRRRRPLRNFEWPFDRKEAAVVARRCGTR